MGIDLRADGVRVPLALIDIPASSVQVLVTFALYLLGVAALGVFAHRYVTKGSFVKEYFLGNRGLGPWVLALTVAATAISGGTFMGFPSLIYTNGWVMALWICSYMVVPLTGMIWLGKRINQVARIGGSVTVPDVFRDRFRSPALGVAASLLILVFVCFNLVAQFKAGGLVMKEALNLPPAAATLTGTETDAEYNLVLTFDTERGPDERKTAYPKKSAVFLGTEVQEARGKVLVWFADGFRPIVKTVSFPPQKVSVLWFSAGVDRGYLLGLIIFALTVVAYTTYGGFWAVTWTDVLEGIVMLVGVIVMAVLAVRAVPETNGMTGLAGATESLRQQDPELVTGPGPGASPILPLGIALSFFLMWSVSSAGQPSGMVRLMSFKDSKSLSRALVLIAVYYLITYVALLVIFVSARAIFPTQYLREVGSEGEPDSIMPAMARYLTRDTPWVGGLLLAAPYAAIMSTVAAFLLLISSSLVRDLYQRTISPKASEKTLKRVSYATTGLVGLIVLLGSLNPPDFLQYVIVFTGTGQSCAFLFPMVFTLYWRRTTRQGVLAGMIGGGLTVLVLYALGWLDSGSRSAVEKADKESRPAPAVSVWLQDNLAWIPGWGEKRPDRFAPVYAGGLDPLVWGFAVSLLLTVGVSLRTRPDPELVKKYFPQPPPG